MAKKIKMKEILFHISNDIESVNNSIKKQNLELEEQNKINKDRLRWEKETKDRVNISLKEYQEMKERIAYLEAKEFRSNVIFEKIKMLEHFDKIDTSSIVVGTMRDHARLSTRVNIQFDCRDFIEPYTDITPSREMEEAYQQFKSRLS